MAKLTALKNDCYLEVMTLLWSVGFNVVAISVDNATTNLTFFINCLCGSDLKTSINDPVPKQPIFLIFDPVHDIKNVYNNLQNRQHFVCHLIVHNLPTDCTARFQHIVDLHDLESPACSSTPAVQKSALCSANNIPVFGVRDKHSSTVTPFDIAVSLKHLCVASDGPRDQLPKVAKDERGLFERQKMTLPSPVNLSHTEDEIDTISVRILWEFHPIILAEHVPISVLGDGNCFFVQFREPFMERKHIIYIYIW